MPKIEGSSVTLNFDVVLLVCAVIISFFVLAVTVRNGIEAIRGLSVRGRVKKLEERLDIVEERLRKGNRRFKAQSDDMGQILLTMQGLLLHFITGNDHEKLRETNDELAAYMAARATREMEESE